MIRVSDRSGQSRLPMVFFAVACGLLYFGFALGLAAFAREHVRENAPAAMREDADAVGKAIALRGVAVAGAMAAGLLVLTLYLFRDYERRLASMRTDLDELVEAKSRELLQSRDAVILGLATLAESRDGQTGRHLERIRGYVRVLGDAMVGRHDEVTPELVNAIVDASVLHDIGKVGIPDDVLRHPRALSAEQREVVKKHTLIGGDTLLAVKRRWGHDEFLVTACEIAFAHHERYDGAGYPFGLAGDVIPIAARIVAVADVYDALTTSRVYRSALSHEEACAFIAAGSGTRFDPVVVATFVEVQSRFAEVRAAES
jgi:putative two-component system response regulator